MGSLLIGALMLFGIAAAVSLWRNFPDKGAIDYIIQDYRFHRRWGCGKGIQPSLPGGDPDRVTEIAIMAAWTKVILHRAIIYPVLPFWVVWQRIIAPVYFSRVVRTVCAVLVVAVVAIGFLNLVISEAQVFGPALRRFMLH